MRAHEKCLLADCWRPRLWNDYCCGPCSHWALVTLADPRYRTEEPPPAPVLRKDQLEFAVQPGLLL